MNKLKSEGFSPVVSITRMLECTENCGQKKLNEVKLQRGRRLVAYFGALLGVLGGARFQRSATQPADPTANLGEMSSLAPTEPLLSNISTIYICCCDINVGNGFEI